MEVEKIDLMGLPISTFGFKKTVEMIVDKNNKNLYVYCCTLNEVMMANENPLFKNQITRGDLLTPDGMPLVWWLKWKSGKGERVYGPDLMKEIVKNNNVKHFFIGDKKNEKYFSKIGKYLVLPYKSEFEDSDYNFVIDEIEKVKPDLIWIGLGSKKQIVMADELKKRGLKKVVITVGAAFDFLSGLKKQAPKIIRTAGLEWVFRLISEPKRLANRYYKIILFLIRRILITT